MGPIVDEILGELPLDLNPQVVNVPIPPINAAPIPEPEVAAPAAEEAIPIIPPPAAPIPPAPENPGPTAEQQDNMRLRREARLIIAECQEFIEVHEGLEMNSALLASIEKEALRLALLITSSLN